MQDLRPRSTAKVVIASTMAAALVACGAESTESPQSGAQTSVSPPVSTTQATPPVGLAPTTVIVPQALAQAPFDQPREALVPPGWTIEVWARVPEARLAAWAPDDVLLVSVPATGQVLSLNPEPTVLLEGLEQPHGLAFDGSTLYVAQSDQVTAYEYTDGQALDARVVAPDLPDAKSPDLRGAYSHALKSVAIGPDGSIYFSIGSTANVSEDDLTADPPRATIMRIPPGGGPAEPFAVGVRNGTGLAIAFDGSVWTAVNNRDNIAYPYDQPYGDATESALGQVIPEYVDDHPIEAIARLTDGRNLGWPFCNPDADVDPGVAGSAHNPANVPFVTDVQTNADGSRLDCSTLPPVEQSMGAHSAPLGLSFGDVPAPFGQGALIGVHGSWNRTSPRAPEVSFYSWSAGKLGNQQTMVGGFQSDDGTRWGRPVAAVVGTDGAVYVTDDDAGAVYRVTPPQ
ncbi:MAG: PQQ-dependent sugar dehydrogenase [Mycobacterium sp.]